MKTWLITGSQAGVGKSTLMKRLADILGDAVCIKLGHGLRKTGGWKNYFTQTEDAIEFIKEQDSIREHCLVESNRLVGKIHTDTIIFLDTLDGERRRDSERLRASAGVILDKKSKEKNWGKGLKDLELDETTFDAVMEALRGQREYLTGSRLIIRTKVWLSRDSLLVFGEGLARLLRGIEGMGSLSAAAREEGISYRHAWGDIKRAEERLGFPLVESTPGGVEGGGSSLTEKGRLLLQGYERMRRKIIKSSDKFFKELLEKIEEAT